MRFKFRDSSTFYWNFTWEHDRNVPFRYSSSIEISTPVTYVPLSENLYKCRWKFYSFYFGIKFICSVRTGLGKSPQNFGNQWTLHGNSWMLRNVTHVRSIWKSNRDYSFSNKMNLFIQRQRDHVNALNSFNANLNVEIEIHWMLVRYTCFLQEYLMQHTSDANRIVSIFD